MQYPIELICQRTPPTHEVEADVFEAIRQLGGYCDHITGCQVLIRGPAHSDDGAYTVSLKLRTPDAEMTIAGGRPGRPEHRSLKLALRDAFAQAYELRMLELPLCSCSGGRALHG